MSVPYTMDPGLRAAMAPHHRTVQTAIAVLASQQMGVPVDPLIGIGKYQGGVRVNEREICIRQGSVTDDWKRKHDGGTPEEHAVAAAIGRVESLYQLGGLTALRGVVLGVEDARTDPLRSMFEAS